MSTTHTVHPSKTLSEYAKDIKEATAKAYAVEAEIEPAIKALRSLPKTPTGKTTKAVKQAEEALLAKRSAESNKLRSAENRLNIALRKAAKEFNRLHTSPAVVGIVLKRHGFEQDIPLTAKLQETTEKVTKLDEEKPGARSYHGAHEQYNQHVFITAHTRVYVNKNIDAYCAVRFKPESDTSSASYKIIYLGDAPVSGTLGDQFNSDTGCISSHQFHEESPASNGRINLSAIGSEFAPDCARRLKQILVYIELSEGLAAGCPRLSTRFNADYLFDDGLIDALANGEKLLVVRRTSKAGLICGDKHRDTVLLTKAQAELLGADADLITCGCVNADEAYETKLSSENGTSIFV